MTTNQQDALPANQKKQVSIKLVIGLSLAIIIFCVLTCVSQLYVFKGKISSQPNIPMVENKTIEFVSALQQGQTNIAYGLLSTKTQQSVKLQDVEQLSQEPAIDFFKTLQICQFTTFYNPEGRVIDAYGLLYYGNEIIGIQSTLFEEEKNSWKVQGFFFKPDLEPKPWGACGSSTQP